MKRIVLPALATAISFAAVDAQAWSQETHRRIAQDAVAYMQANPTTTNFAKLQAAATAAGYTVTQMAAILGQGAYDVDSFNDTYICGATTGDCQPAPLWGFASDIVRYTCYFHFQQHTRGADAHGNDLGGYNYQLLTVWGDIDNMAASWLVGDYMDDGKGGMTGWFSRDTSRYNTYGITEANYRQGSTSSKSMYDDFEEMPFQPIDNLGQYWYSKFQTTPTFQTLGFVLHTTDLLQPHHTWTTSALNHSGWETWVNDNYYTQSLNSHTKIAAAMADFTPVATTTTQIRPLLTQGGLYSYQNGGAVLNSTADADRITVANKAIPHAIAMTVHILNHAANRF